MIAKLILIIANAWFRGNQPEKEPVISKKFLTHAIIGGTIVGFFLPVTYLFYTKSHYGIEAFNNAIDILIIFVKWIFISPIIVILLLIIWHLVGRAAYKYTYKEADNCNSKKLKSEG